ncbi:MAG: hypothetical protein IKU88_05285 [Alistipes sp.]|nr:hypothetical protein [Alistipes sp.]
MKRLIPIVALMFVVMTACTPRNRVVENPYIEIVNDLSLDIKKVELRDTATIVTMVYDGFKGSKIKMVKETYLKVGDEKFVIAAAEGIKLDKWNTIEAEDGVLNFDMIFPPLPPKTKSFDFVEGDGKNAWVMRKIDLTGKAKPAKYHPELPQELRKEVVDQELPKPSYESAMTTVTFHFMGWDKQLFSDVEFKVHHLLGRRDTYTMPVDEETKTATFKYMQYGTATGNVELGAGFRRFMINPGEEMDVWIDMASTGEFLMKLRGEKLPPNYNILFTTGTYSNINRAIGTWYDLYAKMQYLEFDYSMSADECCNMIVEKYKHYADSLQTITEMHPLHKKTASIWLNNSLIDCVLNDIEAKRSTDYWRKNKDDKEFKGYVPLEFNAEQIKKILAPIDLSSNELLLNQNATFYMRGGTKLFDAVGVPKESTYQEAAISIEMLGKAYRVEFSDTELTEFKSNHSPLFYETVKSVLDEEKLKLAIAQGKTEIKTAPKVPNDKLFETILEQYKGKVVFVDFWNVGCTGCHLDFKWIEPLKTGDLSTDNVVWLYIASDISPLNSYIIDIANIKGVHYRLADKQWDAIGKKYGFNYMPCYFIVDKAGQIKMVDDDNRSPSGFRKVIREALKK